MRPLQTIRIRGIAFKAAVGSRRAQLLGELQARELQVHVPVMLTFGAGMLAGAAITVLTQFLL